MYKVDNFFFLSRNKLDQMNQNSESENFEETFGVIILRHVNNEITNTYWMYCYDCIRNIYPNNKILIIDDNSNYEYVGEKNIINTEIIQSEFPGRGELLPYYYFQKTKPFDRALIIHDSVFLNKKIETNTNDFNFLWDFQHNWDQPADEANILSVLVNLNYLIFMHKNKIGKVLSVQCVL